MSFLASVLYLGSLCVRLTSGECQGTSCPCVPREGPIGGTGVAENRCCFYIRENVPPGTVIGNANDLEVINMTTFALESSEEYVFSNTPDSDTVDRDLFQVNSATGDISTAVPIDRENITSENDCVQFSIIVNAGGINPLPTVTAFGVVIMDENDNRPRFDSNLPVPLNIMVNENDASDTLNCQDTVLDTLQATDIDNGTNGTVTYKVAEGEGDDVFAVKSPDHPCVRNLVPMDREVSTTYQFVLVAMDGGTPPLTSNITVIFTLLDINDNPPVFLNDTTEIGVLENTTNGTVIGRFIASDVDMETHPLRYELMSDSAPFQINSETGEVSLTSSLDAESTPTTYSLTVVAIENAHTAELSITITVIDVNEPISIPESQEDLRSEIVEDELLMDRLVLEIIDFDTSVDNQNNTLQLTHGREYFKIGQTIIPPGDLQFFPLNQLVPIDRENVTNGILQLEMVINQFGDPPLQTTYIHNITILDINDNSPYLTMKVFNREETSNSGQNAETSQKIILKDYVKDNDEGMNGTIVSYSLVYVRNGTNEDFTDEIRTANALVPGDNELHDGTLNLPLQLDRERFGSFLTVTMTFTDGGQPPQNRTDSFRIMIIDINDNSPSFIRAEYNFTLDENRPPNSQIGSVVALDRDDPDTGNGQVEYMLNMNRGDFTYFRVDQNNGTIWSTKAFDREKNASFTIYIDARDRGDPPLTSNKSATVRIIVQDLNDEPPRFTMPSYNFTASSGANIGDLINSVKAIDEDLDKEENKIIYKLLYPTPYFSVNNVTGEITLTRVLSIQDAPYNLTVIAYNPGSEQLRDVAMVYIVVSDSSLLTLPLIGGISGIAAFLLVVAILIVCCSICCLRYKSKTTGKHEVVDRNGNPLNNQKPILKTFPAPNGQQRSVKFSQTVEETHYDPSGIEHSVIRKESNLGNGDESPQITIRTTMPNGAVSMNGHGHEEILEYEMSPSLGLNGEITHHRPHYSHHGRVSPIMLREELNTLEYSQSTSSVVDDRNTFNSEGDEAESTFSDAPSNFNTSIPRTRFGRQTIQVEDHHHPSDLPHFVAPTSSHMPLDLHAHLPPVHHMHGQHSSPNHLPELRVHNLAALNAQYASTSHPPPPPAGIPSTEDIRDLSLSSLPHNIGHHHHPGSINSFHDPTPPQRHIQRQRPQPGSMHQPPPMSMSHSIVTPPSNGHTNTRNYPHPLVMPEAFPTRAPPTEVHRFDSFIPSFGDYGETSTYASTELNEALEFKYEAEPDFCSLTATDYGENDTEL